MSFQLHKIFVRLRNTIKYILDKNQEACDCPFDCQVNTTVEVQKIMKSIAREVHLPSVVQSEFYEATIILFVCKENKNNDFFQQFVSSRSLLVSVAPFCILPIERKQRTLFCIRLNAKMRYFHSNQSVNTRRIQILKLKKSHYFYFLCIQKVISSLHKIQIEPLMADGLSWRCFSLFSEPRQWYLLGSQWDSHKPPGFYLKYI